MLNGLDLFTGIGGLTLALNPWVRPIAYCELDLYCQGVLLSQISRGSLPYAPIWDDVRTLRGADVGAVDIIYGGFPCQDLSVAGNGAGLDGERSGLFFEVARLVSEVRPSFVFLENVPAIRGRGADVVGGRLASLGYDCRWGVLSAFDVGAPHLRERWWLLAADAGGIKLRVEQGWRSGESREGVAVIADDGEQESLADPNNAQHSSISQVSNGTHSVTQRTDWWDVEPDVGRVADGIPARVDRLRALGNAVVPQCAREAFRRLMGIVEVPG